MARCEGVPDAVQLEGDVLVRAHRPADRLVPAEARGEVQRAPGDQRGGAVRGHVAQPGRHLPVRGVHPQPEGDPGPAQDLHRRPARHRELEAGGLRVLLPLVRRQVGVAPGRAEPARVQPRVLRRGHGHRRALKPVRDRGDGRRGPGRVPGPAARQRLVHRRRRMRARDPGPQQRLLHHPVGRTLQPVVPPPQRLLEEPDRRTRRQPAVGVLVRPWTNQPADPVGGQAGHQPQHRVPVRVVPAADREDGRADRPVVLADAAVPPVPVPGAVRRPGVDQRLHGLQPGQPLRAPAVAGVQRVRRARGGGQQRRRPRVQVRGEHGAARQVPVVVEAVVGRADRDHRPEGLGRERRDLERVRAAARDPEHPHGPRAPRLRREPLHHRDSVGQFPRLVGVAGAAAAAPVAAYVHPHGGVPVARVPGVALRVARCGRVGQPAREVLQQGRDGLLRHRAPCPRVQQYAVGHRDPDILAGYPVREHRADDHAHTTVRPVVSAGHEHTGVYRATCGGRPDGCSP